MATKTESNKQTLFFVVLGQKYITDKVWAKSETMRAEPLFRYFGVNMELLLKSLKKKKKKICATVQKYFWQGFFYTVK